MSVIDPRVLEATGEHESPSANLVRSERNISVLTYSQHANANDVETTSDDFRIILDVRPFTLHEVSQATCRVFHCEDGSRIFLISAIPSSVTTGPSPREVSEEGVLQTASLPSSLLPHDPGTHHNIADDISHHPDIDTQPAYGPNVFDEYIEGYSPCDMGVTSAADASGSHHAMPNADPAPVPVSLPYPSNNAGTLVPGPNPVQSTNNDSRDLAQSGFPQPPNSLGQHERPSDWNARNPPNMGVATSRRPQVKPLKPSDWDSHWPEIIDLYKNQNCTLNQVRHAMAVNYNFKATPSMYKKQLKDRVCTKYKSKSTAPTTCDRGVGCTEERDTS